MSIFNPCQMTLHSTGNYLFISQGHFVLLARLPRKIVITHIQAHNTNKTNLEITRLYLPAIYMNQQQSGKRWPAILIYKSLGLDNLFSQEIFVMIKCFWQASELTVFSDINLDTSLFLSHKLGGTKITGKHSLKIFSCTKVFGQLQVTNKLLW